MQAVFRILVVPEPEEDWQGDPIEPAPTPREVTGCAIIPRTHPDDETLIIDGFQVFIMDTTQTPPAAEDKIKILDYPFVDPTKRWEIDGNVGPYAKPSGQLKAVGFNVKSVR